MTAAPATAGTITYRSAALISTSVYGYDAAVDPDRHLAYVAGRAGLGAPPTIAVIDTRTRTVLDQQALAARPSAVVVDPSTHLVYLADAVSNTVSVLTASPLRVVATIALPASPRSAAIDPAVRALRVGILTPDSNGNSNPAVVSIDLRTNAVSAPVAVPAEPDHLAVDTSSHRVFGASFGGGTVFVVNPATQRASSVASFGVVRGLAVDPGLGQVYVSSSPGIIVVGTRSLRVTEKVDFGQWFVGSDIGVDPVTHAVFISSVDGAAVLDGRNFTIPPTTIRSPGGLSAGQFAVDTTTHRAYYALPTGLGTILPTITRTATPISVFSTDAQRGIPVHITGVVDTTGDGTVTFSTPAGVLPGCRNIPVAGDPNISCTATFARAGTVTVTVTFSGSVTDRPASARGTVTVS